MGKAAPSINIEDLKCCGNCDHIYFEYENYCCDLKKTVSSLNDIIDPDNSCQFWEWDGLTSIQRVG